MKFAGIIGGFLGWFGWPEVGIGTLLAFVLNGLIALIVLLSRRGSMRSGIPFGPAMMAGAVLAVVIG